MRSAGLEDAARSMLRVLGGGRAALMVPQPVAANTQTGLGIAIPMLTEIEMDPVLLHSAVDGKALLALMTRGTVRKALGGLDGADVTAALEGSMLHAHGRQYRVVGVTVKQFGGAELMYELEIEA